MPGEHVKASKLGSGAGMHFDELDSEPFKQWIIKKLENIFDADSDVLADYVLALVKTDDPEP
ncbi:hypothetical protein KC316_g21565, partial [Hortaea werneckii]